MASNFEKTSSDTHLGLKHKNFGEKPETDKIKPEKLVTDFR